MVGPKCLGSRLASGWNNNVLPTIVPFEVEKGVSIYGVYFYRKTDEI